MTGKGGPGRSEREGLSVVELFKMFPDDAAAERWFEEQRWQGDNRECPDCGSGRYQTVSDRDPMPYRCRDCHGYFSVKKGTLMESSKLGLQKWAVATYMVMTSLKGVSSMKLHRELGVSQKTAWFMLQRIREALNTTPNRFEGPVEVDETFVGGREKNKHAHKKLNAGRGTVGKTAVAGAKDRATGKVSAAVVLDTSRSSLQPFVIERTEPGATVYTDDHGAYRGMLNVEHESVSHSVGEYVRAQAHTNGVESFWAMLKRGLYGTYHHVSVKHLQRYVDEFSGRHNLRSLDTIDQMAAVAVGMAGKRLRHADLVVS